MVLVKNLNFFNLLFVRSNRHKKKVFHDILVRKSAILYDKNIEFKNWHNLHFSKGVIPWFWSKISHFFYSLFCDQIGPKKVFHGVLDRKLVSVAS